MAAFIVETGELVADATSYVSVEEANDYLSVRPSFSTWDALSDSDKELKLIWATRLLDQRVTYKGTRYSSSSALRWPRTGVVDCDGTSIAYTVIPDALKEAVIEMAFHLTVQGTDPSMALGGGDISKIRADVIEIEFVNTNATQTQFPIGLKSILKCIGSLDTGTGMGFGQIRRV